MRVLLADDHDLVRDAVAALMQADDPDTIILNAASVQEAITVADQDDALDIIVLDLKMPGMDGLNGAQKMMSRYPSLPLVILSGTATSTIVRAALKIGVRGFLPKTLSGPALMNALRLIIAGETYAPSSLLSATKPSMAEGMTSALTPREAEVLSQLRLGGSNKEIGNALEIAETTVKLHLKAIAEKLQAKNRTDIVVKAFDSGLI